MWTGRRQLSTPPHHLPWGTTPVKHPKITVTIPAQQDGPGSMASIYRYYDGLGRGEFLSRASHPSGKIKKEKAEIFSFHQNRKELGEVGGGWGDDGWRLRCILYPAVVFREGKPGAPAHEAHCSAGRPWVPPVWPSLAAQGHFCPLPPRPVCRTHTDAHVHTDPFPSSSPAHPSHTHITHHTDTLAHPHMPHQIPQEKRSHPGWAGLGRSAFLTYLFFPPLEHCPGSPKLKFTSDSAPTMTSRMTLGKSLLLWGLRFSSVIKLRSFPHSHAASLGGKWREQPHSK